MKIDINLASPESRLHRMLRYAAPMVIVLAAALLIQTLMAAGRQFDEYRKVHRSILRYRAEINELQVREAKAQQILRGEPTVRLYQQINFLNSLIDQKKVSLSGLTSKVTRLLPSQARLTSLSLTESQDGPMVKFSVEGAESEAVYQFLRNLERSPDFNAVTVMDQAFDTNGASKGMVTLTCSARYVGAEGVNPAAGGRQP
jgi:hypothetical protein